MINERRNEIRLGGVLLDLCGVVLVERLGGGRFSFRRRSVGFGMVRSFRLARRNEERESEREEKCVDGDTPRIAFYSHREHPLFPFAETDYATDGLRGEENCRECIIV